MINDTKINKQDEKIAIRVERSLLRKIKAISMGSISYAVCSLADYALNDVIKNKKTSCSQERKQAMCLIS